MSDEAPNTLVEIQRFFARWVMQPQPLHRVADERPAHARERVADVVQAADEDAAIARLSIYHRMVFARLLASLTEDFPALAAVVGERAFRALAAEFLVAHPSGGPNLRDVGRPLPGFLARLPRQRPDLAELAQLEWARVHAFDARDEAPLTVAQLHAAGERLPRVRLVAGTRVIAVRHDIDTVWAATDRSEPIPMAAARPGALLVWKRAWVVWHRRLEPWERATLPWLRGAASRDGVELGELCVRLADAEDPESVARVWARLRQWIDEGLLTVAPR
ncbi:MAG: DNA-binding domain-containing protein [Nannocystaceae bacterium]